MTGRSKWLRGLSEAGFQSGAVEAANLTSVHLVHRVTQLPISIPRSAPRCVRVQRAVVFVSDTPLVLTSNGFQMGCKRVPQFFPGYSK